MWIRATVAAGVLFASLAPARGSGCFGGRPDITPRNGSVMVPANGRITIAQRVPAGVSWLGPDGRKIAFRERQAGSGPSAARILVSNRPLRPGIHTIQTTDPDLSHTFTVTPSDDSSPPRLAGMLSLEAFHSPEPSSECPENIFIRARFPAPHDDGTHTNDLTYLVQVRHVNAKETVISDLMLPAEAIVGSEIFFRFGETGCGCIPHSKLEPGATYEVTLRAVDAAGNESANTLSGTVTMPVVRAVRGRALR